MASENNSSTSNNITNTFTKGLVTDLNESYVGEGFWTRARNANNNSHDGQTGVLGNEPSNLHCITLPYTLIGAIPLIEDNWVLFTTDDTNSEIGLYNENQCTYSSIVNDPCLGFKKSNLIVGTYREVFDCTKKIYWSDGGLNPDRVMDINNPPYIQKRVKQGDCYIVTNTSQLDCEKLRLAELLTIPGIDLKKGRGSGTLPNGTYQATIAYSINEIKVTDYLILSEPQGLFSHENDSGSLELNLTSLDNDFDEFELVIISTINAQTVAKKLGTYSTSQSTVYIDTIDPTLTTVSLSLVPLRTPSIDKSDGMYNVGDYLLRLGVYTKPDFNYQQQANKIVTKWVSVKYPADYYHKGGNKASYMRDEQYPFFIRWVYNTGDKSASYVIPGRDIIDSSEISLVANQDAIEPTESLKWQVYNTATVTSLSTQTLPDGGIIIAEGLMGYTQSTEIYPDDKPQVWRDLCGKNIRHHKFPDASTHDLASHFNPGGTTINILGVKFEEITHPLDNNGNPIESIIGYEILRGSREGQKTIIAKGIINNMRQYALPNNTIETGLYSNYPYNDLRPDGFLTLDNQNGTNGRVTPGNNLQKDYRKDIFTFHSPETTFSNPFLSSNELKLYQELVGTTDGQFETPYKHPKFKVTTNADDVIGDIVGVLSVLNVFQNGIEIGSTQDYPIGLKIGPLPPLPYLPIDEYGLVDSNPITTALNYATFAFQGLSYIAEAVTLISTMKTFADLEKEKFFSLMRTIIPKVQYAAQYNSHGFYKNFVKVQQGNTRRIISNSNYIKDNIQSFNTNFRINNLNRGAGVVLQTTRDVQDPSTQDNSRVTLGEANTTPYNIINSTISSYYTALKVDLPSQYGQIESIKQIPITTNISNTVPNKLLKFTSDIIFGGDTYINRFTEKNSFFYFYDWLFNFPDEFEYDYTQHINIPYPRFWINNIQYMRSILKVSSDYRVLDARQSSIFYVSRGYFYLFNSGVRDFFVESEINLAYRDWDDIETKRFYDPYAYTDLSTLFRSDLIKSGNFFKYDYSLSNSKLFNSYINWGNVLNRDYDPLVSQNCFSYYPKRIMYSLPQNLELKKDNWSSFLPNNYKDFSSKVTSIKSINKSGALIMMKTDSPVQFMGVDQLQTDGGIKVTIGDGGLFNQPLQSITNADRPYQYGSCQSVYSAIATTYGVFYISQDQGKIFSFDGNLDEISRYGNKWWFSQYLPSFLLKQYPNYKLFDNPVIGVGCQAIYDNIDDILYFTKKDYKPLVNNIILDSDNKTFYISGGFTEDVEVKNIIELTDPNYFEDASWTVSYDPKNKMWLSYHDWKPNFVLPGKFHFMTIQDNTIWKHNVRCDSYCNFYGVDYPFEVEFVSSSGQTVNTIRSVEYILETYQYNNNCSDKWQILDNNFDRAIIYNSEQVSGVLKLNITPKNNPIARLTYPIVGGNGIDILYSKEENKIRFNQFYDVTKNRGEFNLVQQPMLLTKSNGYVFQINPSYIDYTKSALEHKKFRQAYTKLFLRKMVSGNYKMLFKISNTKTLISPR